MEFAGREKGSWRDMSDKTIEELEKMVQKFCEVRDWDQFHNPKDLAIGISTEANELLDIFRFKSEDDMKEIMDDVGKREHVTEELADVFFFLLRFAQMNQIDLYTAVVNKLEKNNRKYPVNKIKGKNLKYTEL